MTTLWQLGASLGIGGLIAVGFYKIALVLIRAWTASDAARTMSIGTGFKEITDAHADLLKQSYDNHQQLVAAIGQYQAATTQSIANLTTDVRGLDTAMRVALDLTPVHHQEPPKQPVAAKQRAASKGGYYVQDDDAETPVEVPFPTPSRTPTPTQRAKSQPIVSGEWSSGVSKPNKLR